MLDRRFSQTTKGAIKGAAGKAGLKEKKEAMEASRKVGDRVSDNQDLQEYMKVLSLQDARVWMRVRARGAKGVKVNCKSSFRDLSCRQCLSEASVFCCYKFFEVSLLFKSLCRVLNCELMVLDSNYIFQTYKLSSS